ncbi:MAG: DUF2163 domain-containing protein [Oceanicaulis sp.]
MIDIPAALQARLDAGCTTIARAFVVTRGDGQVFGFTDHDRALSVAGVECRPDAGLISGEARAEAGFTPARGAVFGAIEGAVLTEADLDNGVWDGARVELYHVDWSQPSLFYKAFTGELGAIRRSESGFEAELEGPSARLDRVIGRVFSSRCDAELGDARCGADLSGAAFGAAATAVSSRAPGAVVVSDVSAAAGWFTHGVLTWTSGANEGARHRIFSHRSHTQGAALELDPAPAAPVQAGDEAALTAGCDKRFATCRDKFSNSVNFRGCPHMPGNDVLVRSASSEPVRDGSKR